MNDRTIKFMRDLKSQVESFYNQVTLDVLGSSKDEAWALVSEMIAAILREIYEARIKMFGTDVFEEGDEEEKVAMSLTNAFRAHAKMDEINKAGFSQHACVVPALSLHLFSRKASIQTILNLGERIANLEKRIKSFDSLQPISRSELDTRFAALKAMIEKNARDAKGPVKKV